MLEEVSGSALRAFVQFLNGEDVDVFSAEDCLYLTRLADKSASFLQFLERFRSDFHHQTGQNAVINPFRYQLQLNCGP